MKNKLIQDCRNNSKIKIVERDKIDTPTHQYIEWYT